MDINAKDFIPNVESVTLKRVKGGWRVCGTLSVTVGEMPMHHDVCYVIKDSMLRRAGRDVRAEAGRVSKRIRKAVKK